MSDALNALTRLNIVQVPVGDISQNSYNPNRQSEHEFSLLVKSMEMDGITQPIIVSRITNEIVDGEHRWRAAKACGYTHVPVVYVDMTQEQMRISTLRHNRARGSENVQLAADVLKELADMGALMMATSELQLDQVEVQRLMKEMGSSDAASLSGTVEDHLLGSDGTGLTAADVAAGVDQKADVLRAKEKIVQQVKREEERTMSTTDQTSYRLVCLFSATEADTVRGVLGDKPAEAIVALCREFGAVS